MPTYPGVYIEEIPSGVRTITGVATSITAFLGRALWGPQNVPVTINSFADFERQFGGLGVDYPMSYAVADFYRNGGSQAIIVRLFKPPATGTGLGRITIGGLKLDAASPGDWSTQKVDRSSPDGWSGGLSATVDTKGITDLVAQRFGLSKGDLFNLTVTQKVDGRIVNQERLLNLTVKDTPVGAGRAQRIDRVLQQSSQLVRIAPKADGTGPDLPAVFPPVSGTSGTTSGTGTAGSTAGTAGSTAGTAGSTAGTSGSTGAAAVQPPSGASGGSDSLLPLELADFIGDPTNPNNKTGLYALETVDLFNLLCIPPDTRGGDTPTGVYPEAMAYCQKRRAMLIVDPPTAWGSDPVTAASTARDHLGDLNLNGIGARNAVLYFPRVIAPDPLSQGQNDTFVPCGIVAGIMAATDAQRGVWKAPAGLDAGLVGVGGLSVKLTDAENGMLNPLGINCLRNFPVYGNVVWGARTLRGADQMADEYKYVPVRRLALYIEESLFRGTQWVVFEPNDEPLWASIRLNVGAFMHNLFVKRAFQGQTPASAYFVKCDKDTTTQNDIDLGIVNILVGFAPLKPAEFVVIQIQQIAGDILT